jgi:hypothetical protein
MPSFPISAYNTHNTHVLETPVMGSFPEVWEGRQASDIVMEDVTFKPKPFATNVEVEYVSPNPIHTDDDASADHTTRIRLHNPYSITEPLTEVYSCTCGVCNYVETSAPADNSYEEEIAFEMPVSKFMPPAPPRIDTYDVIVACGAADPDTVIYNMMMRWYAKVAKVQSAFHPESDCPPPSPTDYSFADWCEMVNQWWFKNFEHRQKKVFAQPHHPHHQTGHSQPFTSNTHNNNGRQFHQRRW